MKTLQSICESTLHRDYMFDGHIHLFSHRGLNPDSLCPMCVGFADIELDHLKDYDVPALYDKYLPQVRCMYPLATGLTIDDIKSIYKAHKDKIAGFGELKLYDSFKDKPLNFKKISFAREVCKFSEECGCLPVYIHYELCTAREVQFLSNLLNDFPDVPVVLCHCGMNQNNHQYAYGVVVELMSQYSNLWVDVSWDASDWFSHNPMLLTQLDRDRVIWGSDLSPRLAAHGYISSSPSKIEVNRQFISTYLDSDTNIIKLFKK